MLKRIRKAPKESGARTCLPLRLNNYWRRKKITEKL